MSNLGPRVSQPGFMSKIQDPRSEIQDPRSKYRVSNHQTYVEPDLNPLVWLARIIAADSSPVLHHYATIF